MAEKILIKFYIKFWCKSMEFQNQFQKRLKVKTLEL